MVQICKCVRTRTRQRNRPQGPFPLSNSLSNYGESTSLHAFQRSSQVHMLTPFFLETYACSFVILGARIEHILMNPVYVLISIIDVIVVVLVSTMD